MIGDYCAKEAVWEVGRSQRGLPVKAKHIGSFCWFYEERSDSFHRLITHMTKRKFMEFWVRLRRAKS